MEMQHDKHTFKSLIPLTAKIPFVAFVALVTPAAINTAALSKTPQMDVRAVMKACNIQ
jgi:hypothetical protein